MNTFKPGDLAVIASTNPGFAFLRGASCEIMSERFMRNGVLGHAIDIYNFPIKDYYPYQESWFAAISSLRKINPPADMKLVEEETPELFPGTLEALENFTSREKSECE